MPSSRVKSSLPNLTAAFAEFSSALNVNGSRIGSRPRLVFLCGGRSDSDQSLRSHIIAALKASKPSLHQSTVLAEDVFDSFSGAAYDDLLMFEQDLAELCSLIVIVAEGPGAIAELGAFSLLETTKPRLLVIVDEQHYAENSFIRLGPVEHVRQHSEDQVLAYQWLAPNKGPLVIERVAAFSDELLSHIERIANARSRATEQLKPGSLHDLFVLHSFAHLAGAVRFEEAKTFLKRVTGFDVGERKLKQYLKILSALNLVTARRRGNVDFYVGSPDAHYVEWAFADGARFRDMARWKAVFRATILVSDKGRAHILRKELARQ